MFRPVGELDFIAIYKHILTFWDEHKCFQTLVEKNRRGHGFLSWMGRLRPITLWVCITDGGEP